MSATRLNQVVDLVFRKLSQIDPHSKDRFLFGRTAGGQGKPIFTISERAPVGQQWEDTGQKYRDHGGPNLHQIQHLLRTSPSNDDVADRIIAHFVYGRDVMNMPQESRGVSLQDIEAIIAKRVSDELAKQGMPQHRIEEITHKAVQENALAVAQEVDVPADNLASTKTTKTEVKRRAVPEGSKKRIDAQNAVYLERAEILDIEIKRRTDGMIHAATIRKIDEAWERHLAAAKV